MKPHEEHRLRATKRLRVNIVTVSTSRYEKKVGGLEFSDEAGDAVEEETKKAGHLVAQRKLVSDDRAMLRRETKAFLAGNDDVLLFAGGTGLSHRDVTVETVRPFFEKELEGFGELIRRLSYDEVGSAAVLTRATAGVAHGKLIVCMPGSPGAVTTSMKALVGEFPHALLIARS
jgi:molybdenum cofactor biosynthesis protein B